MSNTKNTLAQTALIATAGFGIFLIIKERSRILRKLRSIIFHRKVIFRNKIIKVVDTAETANDVVCSLRKHCKNYQVLGFDCEWVQNKPVALVQLASKDGLCALFRLNKMKEVPVALQELLEDAEIIKTGVACYKDALLLKADYGIRTKSTLDLRYMALMAGHKPAGLAGLTKAILNVELEKKRAVVTSNWMANELNEQQLEYAANDALAGTEIFKQLINEIEPRFFWQTRDFITVFDIFDLYFDKDFHENQFSQRLSQQKRLIKGTTNGKSLKNNQSRNISTRSKIFYENWYLEAPDGELLCTLDRKKADWYLKQGLGVKIENAKDSFVVRLNFEPKGRADNIVERFYKKPRENVCVVCGDDRAYVRKNVVPREYRKHFPDIMKSHSSHDIVLLCPDCHQFSNMSDQKIRQHLADKCYAPIGTTHKFTEFIEHKELRSAARALLKRKHVIPEERLKVLRDIVLNYFENASELTEELLLEAANFTVNIENDDYIEHGAKVVEQYKNNYGGPLQLENLWRVHFLKTMKPKYMPEYWDVDHNAKRIAVKIEEGQIDVADVVDTGFLTFPFDKLNDVEAVNQQKERTISSCINCDENVF